MLPARPEGAVTAWYGLEQARSPCRASIIVPQQDPAALASSAPRLRPVGPSQHGVWARRRATNLAGLRPSSHYLTALLTTPCPAQSASPDCSYDACSWGNSGRTLARGAGADSPMWTTQPFEVLWRGSRGPAPRELPAVRNRTREPSRRIQQAPTGHARAPAETARTMRRGTSAQAASDSGQN
jgi:hypothetical protein